MRKTPLAGLHTLLSLKSRIIPDPDSALNCLLTNTVESEPALPAKILHEVSEQLLRTARIVPFIHHGISVVSSAEIKARPSRRKLAAISRRRRPPAVPLLGEPWCLPPTRPLLQLRTAAGERDSEQPHYETSQSTTCARSASRRPSSPPMLQPRLARKVRKWCGMRGLNPRPSPCKDAALPLS